MAMREKHGKVDEWDPEENKGKALLEAQLAETLSERTTITRNIAQYSLAFYSMRPGFNLPFTLGSQVLRQPESAELPF